MKDGLETNGDVNEEANDENEEANGEDIDDCSFLFSKLDFGIIFF